MALSDILEEIKKETESKMDALQKEHDKKLKAIDEEFTTKTKEAEEEMDEQVKANSAKVLNKMTTHAKMEAKNKLLKEKRELLEGIFEAALEQLIKSDNYKEMITHLLKHSKLHGEDIEVLPAHGKEEVTRAALSESGSQYRMAEKSADIKGGFILKSKKIEIDNSFESILNQQLKSDLELEIAKSLFA